MDNKWNIPALDVVGEENVGFDPVCASYIVIMLWISLLDLLLHFFTLFVMVNKALLFLFNKIKIEIFFMIKIF